jgi:hypothetical protein
MKLIKFQSMQGKARIKYIKYHKEDTKIITCAYKLHVHLK